MAQILRENQGDERLDHGGEVLRRRLPTVLRVIWPALLVMGLLTTLGAVVVHLEASAHKDGLDQITATGQTRAAVVEVNTLAQGYLDADEITRTQVFDELNTSLQSAKTAHEELMAVTESQFSEVFEGQERLQRVDATLAFNIEEMQSAFADLRALRDGGSLVPVQALEDTLRELTVFSDHYLIMLDHIDLHVARDAQDQLSRLQIYEAGAIAVSGILLILLALLVIRPSHNFIDWQIKELKTSRSQLAEAMIAAEKIAAARERLLATISHDVRGPLQTILLHVEIARAREGGLKDGGEMERIAKSAHRVKTLVDELLDNGPHIEESPVTQFQVVDIVDELVEIYGAQADEYGLALHVDVEEDLPPIIAREGALKRVLENLVTNAIKYTERGEVTIRARSEVVADDRVVVIDVIDTGPGFSPEQREQIFVEGQQLDSGRDGHGLGLAIVQRLTSEALNGDLFVESELGEGSTFSVIIPRAAVPTQSAQDWRPEGFVDQLRQTRAFEDLVVLVAADSQTQGDIREFGAQVMALEDWDFEIMVEHAEDFARAQLLIFDIDRFADRGVSLCERLGQIDFDGPKIALYGEATSVERDTLIAAGCDALLRKPADKVDLVEWLARGLTARSEEGDQAA
jgi:signal transduction histidine kinase